MLKRIKEIFEANINELLDKVEDPETTINQMIRDMDQAVAEMKSNTASAIATIKMTEKRLQKMKGEQRLWQENAETALRTQDEELAKRALLKKRSIEDAIAMLTIQLHEAQVLAEKMKQELKTLEAKYMEAKIKRDNLISKKRVAETRKKHYDAMGKMNQQMEKLTAAEIDLAGFQGFAGFEEKIEKQMAEIDAREELSGDSLEQEFQKMKQDKLLQEELAALKQKMGL